MCGYLNVQFQGQRVKRNFIGIFTRTYRRSTNPHTQQIHYIHSVFSILRGNGRESTDNSETRTNKNTYFTEPRTKHKTTLFLIRLIHILRVKVCCSCKWSVIFVGILFEHSALNHAIFHHRR